ncbi:MAG: serpin family protein [Clostridia bacterium]
MKRIFAMILAMVFTAGLLAGCSGESDSAGRLLPTVKAGTIGDNVVEGNSRFAFDIFNAVYSAGNDENVFLSPASISTALAMTMNGAAGNTLREMEEALRLSGIDKSEINNGFAYLVEMLNRNAKGIEISLANSVWIREGFEVLESFKKVNSDYFAAAMEELDFNSPGARDTINGWVKDNTNGLIESIIDDAIDPATVMFLINTIYFKGEWAVKFDSENTYEADFRLDDKTTGKVDMMYRKGDTMYYDDGDYKMISLPYGEGGVSMDLVLPSEGTSMKAFLKSFGYEEYLDALDGLEERTDVMISIPKFKTEYEISLRDALASLGMKEAFTGACDLSGINGTGNLFISDVKHKTYIDVNEEGTEAAGVTSVEIRLTAIMDPLKFIADRPFLHIIRDTETGTILFMGIFDTP